MKGSRAALGLVALAFAGALLAAPAGAMPSGGDYALNPVFVDGAGNAHLTISDADGAVVLENIASQTALTEPGPIGFEVGGVWYHATRLIAGHSGSAAFATNDPAGRTIGLVQQLSPTNGAIRFDVGVLGPAPQLVTATAVAFEARAGERFLGFGERSNAVDQRGSDVRNYVSEGPYQDAEQPLIATLVPSPGVNPRHDATYYPVPWMLSTAGYGFLLNGDATSTFHLGTDDPGVWSAETDGAGINFTVFGGPKPADALRRMTAVTGRQPVPEAPFYFGPWFQPSGEDAASIEALRAADAPASVGQTYTHYLPCGDQRAKKTAQRERTDLFHAAGLAVTTYFNPMICTNYAGRYGAAAAAGVLTKNLLGTPRTYNYTGSTVFNVGQFDFTAPGADAFYGDLLSEAVGDGYDGWMEDFGEYTPPDSVSADGTPGPLMHNLYPTLYHRSGFRFAQTQAKPLARFNRSGWTGAARYSQIVWGGDPTTSFGFDGLSSSITNGLTMGLSGVSLWGSDIGGYFALTSPQTTPELLERWIEFGFASGVMRTQANGFDITGQDRAQIFDPGILPVWRRYAKLRTQFYPYLAAAQREYNRTGLPMMRSLALSYPDDPVASAQEDEYLFGPDLLAAPVATSGTTSRSVYLPRGRWIDLWRSAGFAETPGALVLGRPNVLTGGRSVEVPAPLDQLPLFVRSGAILPLLAADVDTLTGYGKSEGLVHLSDRRKRMVLLAFPRERRRIEIGRGERITSVPKAREWTLRVRGKVRRRYSLKATMATLARPFRPCKVTLDGHVLRRRSWHYNRRTSILRAGFRTKHGVVRVKACRTNG